MPDSSDPYLKDYEHRLASENANFMIALVVLVAFIMGALLCLVYSVAIGKDARDDMISSAHFAEAFAVCTLTVCIWGVIVVRPSFRRKNEAFVAFNNYRLYGPITVVPPMPTKQERKDDEVIAELERQFES